MSETIIKVEYEQLNKNAKEYIPTKKRIPQIIDFGLKLKEYRPKEIVEYVEADDEDKWFPKYKDCDCCQGFIFKCKGQTCSDLGQCYCKMKDDCDKQVEKENK